MERKILTKKEINHLVFALTKVGCYGVDETNQEYRCPYWDWELKDESNNPGDCAVKHSQKLCILMKVAESGELIFTLRDKTSEDAENEINLEEKTLQKKAELIEQEIIERQQQLEEVERKKRKLKYREPK